MINWPTLLVFLLVFGAVTALGFWAVRWLPGDLSRIYEWGIGGRRFGTVVSWFLLGGDLYTSYTFIAVPAVLYAGGAFGFFAIPYTILAYPIMFLCLPRFWTLARHRGYVTAADFVVERFGSRGMGLAIAITGILASMPYIALQLYGIEVILSQIGLPVEMSLIFAFALMAAYTYSSGLRAPALIAMVKDLAIWIVVLALLFAATLKLGSSGAVFSAVPRAKLLLQPVQYTSYVSLAIGSAFAVWLYPHSVTGLLASNSRHTVRKNSGLLLAYGLLLLLIALLGYVALASGVRPSPTYGTNSVVPELISRVFPNWLSGFAFAALAIGSLVPAAIMSIAAANLFTRNIYREYIRPACSEREEATTAKISSLVVKVGALLFIIAFPSNFSINFQLLGGVFILQTLPSVLIGLYTRWFHKRAVLLGWATGMVLGTWLAIAQHFTTSIFTLTFLGYSVPLYTAVIALAANLVVCCVGTPLCRLVGLADGEDATTSADYASNPTVQEDVDLSPIGGTIGIVPGENRHVVATLAARNRNGSENGHRTDNGLASMTGSTFTREERGDGE